LPRYGLIAPVVIYLTTNINKPKKPLDNTL
jgi:hypothetical protein